MVGNRIFGHSLILCMAAALLFTPWGSLTGQESKEISLVFGLQGHIALGQVHVPYWVLVLSLALGSLVSCLNFLRWTQLSSLLTFALFGWSAAGSLVAIVDFYFNGQVGTGAVLALTCALAGLTISPSDQGVQVQKIYRFEADRRQSRAAA